MLPPPNKLVLGVLVVVDPKGLGSVDGVVEDPKPPKTDDFGASVVELPMLPVVDPKGLGSVDDVVEDPKPPKTDDGFGASVVVVVELILLPSGKGRGAADAVVELDDGGGAANRDDPRGALDVAVSFAGIENGLGALDEPNAVVVLLKSRKPGLGAVVAAKLKAFVGGVGVDDGADFKLSNPANEGGGVGIEGILGFGASLPLDDSSNSF